MKPQDLVILLKIIILGDRDWRLTDLATSLFLSQSEISKSLDRLAKSGLIDVTKSIPAKSALYDLIISGVRYIFPVCPGGIIKGVPTSHSAPPLDKMIVSGTKYVWPYIEGKVKGESIEPLYEKLPNACLSDSELYEIVALVDALRVGKVREQEIAKKELKKRFKL